MSWGRVGLLFVGGHRQPFWGLEPEMLCIILLLWCKIPEYCSCSSVFALQLLRASGITPCIAYSSASSFDLRYWWYILLKWIYLFYSIECPVLILLCVSWVRSKRPPPSVFISMSNAVVPCLREALRMIPCWIWSSLLKACTDPTKLYFRRVPLSSIRGPLSDCSSWSHTCWSYLNKFWLIGDLMWLSSLLLKASLEINLGRTRKIRSPSSGMWPLL